MTATPSLEFCAFSFLAQWQESECALHKAISSAPTEDDIRKALSYFQVARTFKGLNSPGRAAIILQSLNEVRRDQTLSTPEDKVERLASSLQKTFNQFNLSAASKLLWLSHREPFIVYDTRAVKALTRHFGQRFSSYREYSIVWREEYAKTKDSIQAAVEQLPKGRMFMRSCPPSDQELVSMAREAWFMERVFDVFLWEVGVKNNDR